MNECGYKIKVCTVHERQFEVIFQEYILEKKKKLVK